MATYPYISSSGSIAQIVQHLRRSFPAIVDSDFLKRLGVASKNESYLINILRFIGIIDSEGKKTDKGSKVLVIHDDAQFSKAFGELVKSGYQALFTDHGDTAWDLDSNALITFFRQSDESSGVVGSRQASAFRALSALAGHGVASEPRQRTTANKKQGTPKPSSNKTPVSKKAQDSHPAPPSNLGGSTTAFGLTVRVEVNLPADGDQGTYDKIFQSIRKNLIDGK